MSGSMIEQMKKLAASSANASTNPTIERMVPIDKIIFDVSQPRQTFHQPDDIVAVDAQQSLDALAATLKSQGLIQAIVVEELNDGNYRLIAGERRTRAAMVLGWPEIRATVRENLSILQRRALQIVENIQREGLSEMEIASFIRRCVDDGMSQKDVAASFGKSGAWVNSYMKWLDPTMHNRWVANGLVGKAYMLAEIARLTDDEQQVFYERLKARGTPMGQADVVTIREMIAARKAANAASASATPVAGAAAGRVEQSVSDRTSLHAALTEMGVPFGAGMPAAGAAPAGDSVGATGSGPVWPDAFQGGREVGEGQEGAAHAPIAPTYPAGGAITSAESRDMMAGVATAPEMINQAVKRAMMDTVELRLTIQQLHALAELAEIPQDMEGMVQMILPAALVDALLVQVGEQPEGVSPLAKGPRLMSKLDELAR